MPELADTIPGFAEALARERELREVAFFGLCDPILGIEMAPLTIERLNLLVVAKNPYVFGRASTPTDLLQALWICSRAFCADEKQRQRFIRRHSKRVLRDADEGHEAFRAYINDALVDLDSSGSASAEPIASWAAFHVLTVAKETGWSRDVIYKQLPFAEVMQYVRLIERQSGGVVLNPLSGGAKMRWLESINSK